MVGNKTPLIDWVEGVLGPCRRGGSENVMFKCPFHSGGRHRGWSFTMHIHTGLCNCKSCNRGWTLYQLLAELEMGETYRQIKQAGLVSDAPRIPKIAKKGPSTLPEEVLFLFPEAYGKLPFPDRVIDHFDVRYDAERDRVVYPIRDHRRRLRALHYRDLKAVEDWQTRYRFYSPEEFSSMDVVYDETGKDECFINGHVVLPAVWESEYDTIILTEGPKQSMRVFEAGFPNVLGAMGAMGGEQVRVLTKYDARVLLFMDNDEEGQRAAWSYRGKLRWRGVKAHIVDYGEDCEATQPDELSVREVRSILEHNIGGAHAGRRQVVESVQRGQAAQEEESPVHQHEDRSEADSPRRSAGGHPGVPRDVRRG